MRHYVLLCIFCDSRAFCRYKLANGKYVVPTPIENCMAGARHLQVRPCVCVCVCVGGWLCLFLFAFLCAFILNSHLQQVFVYGSDLRDHNICLMSAHPPPSVPILAPSLFFSAVLIPHFSQCCYTILFCRSIASDFAQHFFSVVITFLPHVPQHRRCRPIPQHQTQRRSSAAASSCIGGVDGQGCRRVLCCRCAHTPKN